MPQRFMADFADITGFLTYSLTVATSTESSKYKQDLIQFVHACCKNLPVTAKQVIDDLLSVSQ